MKGKYAPPIQHTIYKDGYKQALHDVGDALDDLKKIDLRPLAAKTVAMVEVLLGKLTL